MYVVRQGSGPVLMLVHGIGMSHHAFDGVIEDLAADHEVVAVDLPGFGESAPLPGPPTMRALADACAELVDGPFAVAGNSLGGGVALHLALDGRARAACAVSPVGFVEGWERLWLQAAVRSSRTLLPVAAPFVDMAWARRLLLSTFAAHGERITGDQLRQATADVRRPGLAPTAGHALNWRAPAAASLPCPVTIAWGAKDRLLLAGPQSARARARMPTARHLALDDVGHLPGWDDPALLARVIRDAV